MKGFIKFMFPLCALWSGAIGVHAQTAEKTYVPIQRVTHLQPGKQYMFYNASTTSNEGEKSDYSGFLKASADKVAMISNTKPIAFETTETACLWELEAKENGTYAVKNVATKNYLGKNGALSTTAVAYQFQEWTVSSCTKDAVLALDHRGILIKRITPSSRLFTISFSESNSVLAWRGTTTRLFEMGNKAQPFAVYEVSDQPLDVRLKEAGQAAQVLLDKTPEGLGYPDANQRGGLQFYLGLIDNPNNPKVSEDTYWEFLNQIEDFKNANWVTLPTSGKAYTFTNVRKDGVEAYLNWDETQQNVVAVPRKKGEKLPETAVFICRKLKDVTGDQPYSEYMFVNNAGKYFTWFCDEAKHNPSGTLKAYLDTYDYSRCKWTLVPAMRMEGKEEKMGLFGLEGVKMNGNATSTNYLLLKTDEGTFHSSEPDHVFDGEGTGSFSSYWRIEEATYANEVKVNEIKGNRMMSRPEGYNYISTFSAPFPTDIPGGVSAYRIVETPEKGAVKMVEVQSPLPANEGVILLANGQGPYTMVPSTHTAASLGTSNWLGNTAGKAHVLEENSYVIANGPDKINNPITQFYQLNDYSKPLRMNKAYLKPVPSSVFSLSLNFGETATGLENVETEENPSSPIYDLSGRRILQPIQGHLYIQKGKKFIAQ